MKIKYLELLQKMKDGESPDYVIYNDVKYHFDEYNYIKEITKPSNDHNSKYLYYNIFGTKSDVQAVNTLIEIVDDIKELEIPIIDTAENERLCNIEQKVNEIIKTIKDMRK